MEDSNTPSSESVLNRHGSVITIFGSSQNSIIGDENGTAMGQNGGEYSWNSMSKDNVLKKIIDWLYSFSLLIFTLLTLGFSAVTPIDVIAKTSGRSASGIKMFIVIIVCVVFLVGAIMIYLSRIFQYRMEMNDIPSRSLYILSEDDVPKDVYKMIHEKLQHNTKIADMAGPLHTKKVLNYPGLAPPNYIQEMNAKHGDEGNLLPPNACYEDIVKSLSDNLKFGGKSLTSLKFPKNLTSREYFTYVSELYLQQPNADPKKMHGLGRLSYLYEKFRFGPDLIEEKEMFEFISLFYEFGQIIQNSLPEKTSAQRENQKKPLEKDSDYLGSLFTAETGAKFRDPFSHHLTETGSPSLMTEESRRSSVGSVLTKLHSRRNHLGDDTIRRLALSDSSSVVHFIRVDSEEKN